jgi:signal transduction histidine kinase
MFAGYTYSPVLLPQFFTALFLLILGVYSVRRRTVPGALPFAAGCLFALLWVAGSIMEYAAVDLETKTVWFKFQAVWQLPTITAITCFIFEYVWPGRWLTRRNIFLLSILPLLFLFLGLTNDYHHLIWQGFVYNSALFPLRGPAIYLFIAYGYLLAVVEVLLLLWLFRRSPAHRWPVAIMLAGDLGAGVLYGLLTFDIGPPGLPLDVLVIAFVFLMYAIALFAFHIFDPVPLARQMAIEQLQAGVLVLDSEGRVASLNPAAERILSTPANQAVGKSIGEQLAGGMPELLAADRETEVELTIGNGVQTRHYSVAILRLGDWRGLDVGCLLLLHDVTEQKRAQAQIIEQQRALATLQERERLARELHDSTGQVLSYVSMQAQAIRKNLDDGRSEQAGSQLSQLAAAAAEAHADIRESILSLKAGCGNSAEFLHALQEYLAVYSNNYGLHSELSDLENLSAEDFTPDTTVQLLRVIGEALTNARKHSGADSVQVSLVREDQYARIVIADDGDGFDINQPAGGQNHFGLAFMRERMAQVGGDLEIASRPGKGTRVVLRVPVRERKPESL